MLRGLPHAVTVEQIKYFFKDFKITDSDVVIELRNGKRTGLGLVFLESEAKFHEAVTKLDKKNIGERFIELKPV